MVKKKSARKTKRASRADVKGSYGLKDVCRIVGVKRSQVEYWVRSQIVQPQMPSIGTGNHRRFNFANLVEFDVARLLSSAGFPLDELLSAMHDGLRLIDPADDVERGPVRQAIWRDIYKTRDAYFAKHPERLAEVNRALDASPIIQDFSKSSEWLARDDVQAQLKEDVRLWRQFKNPATRSVDQNYFLFRTVLVEERGTWFVNDWNEFQRKARETEAVHAVNLRSVLERLEAATGDSWRPWEKLRA